MRPRKRFIPFFAAPEDLPGNATDPAIFGLLDPMALTWCSKTFHYEKPVLHTIVSDIMDGRNLALLEIQVHESDDVHVADWGVHLRKDYHGMRGEDKQVISQVKRNYWNSLVPLADYIGRDRSYTLPEVICFPPYH